MTAVHARPSTAWDAFAAQAVRTPDRTAVVGDGWRLTYAALRARAEAVAEALAAVGVGAGELVVVTLQRDQDLLPGLLGVWAHGAAFVPVAPATPGDRLRRIVTDAGAVAVVRGADPDERLDRLLGADAGMSRPRVARLDPVARPLPPDPALAYVIYTSGSTGTPKGVEVLHPALLHMRRSFAAAIDEPCRSGAGPCRVGASSSIAFDVFVQHLTHLFDGDELHLATERVRTDEIDFVRWVRGNRLTVVSATPGQVPALLQAGLLDDGHSCARLLVGAEAMPRALWRRLGDAPVRTFNIYGATETTVNAAVAEIDPAVPEPHIGRPLAGCDWLIVGPDGAPVAGPGSGELCFRGALLAKGYRGLPDLTGTRFVASPAAGGERVYRTGDRVRRDADGRVSVLGRLDRQLKIHGHRIEPAEIERSLTEHRSVARAAVVPVFPDDPRYCLVAVLVGSGPAAAGPQPPRPVSEQTARVLRSHLASRVPPAMVPRYFLSAAELPLTEQGKVDEAALIGMATAAVAAAGAGSSPGTPAQAVRAVWREVLGDVRDDATVAALGGSSLDALRIVARLSDTYGAVVTAGGLLRGMTLGQCTEAVAGVRAPGARAGSGRGHEPGGEFPLSDAQRRLWIEELTRSGESAYHLALAYRIRGRLDPAALDRAVEAVVAKHPALRLAFALRGRAPVQRVLPPGAGGLLTAEVAGARDTPPDHLPLMLAERAARPIDLEHGPPVRFELLRLAPDDHLFLLTVHHLVADGWSLGVLTGDLSAAYAAAVAGRLESPGPRWEFLDHVRRGREAMTPEREQFLVAHWAAELHGVPDHLEPPGWADGATGAGVLVAGLDGSAAARLRALAREYGTTLHTVLLTLFQDALHEWAGADDVVVGVPFAGRVSPEAEAAVGYFVNVLPIRSRRCDPASLPARVRRSARSLADAMDHADVPFDRLVQALRPERRPGRAPLVQVVFRLESADFDRLSLPDVVVDRLELPCRAVPFEVEAIVDDRSDGSLGCRLLYRRTVPEKNAADLLHIFIDKLQ